MIHENLGELTPAVFRTMRGNLNGFPLGGAFYWHAFADTRRLHPFL